MVSLCNRHEPKRPTRHKGPLEYLSGGPGRGVLAVNSFDVDSIYEQLALVFQVHAVNHTDLLRACASGAKFDGLLLERN